MADGSEHRDPDDKAELVDEDTLEDLGQFPPDRPLGVDELLGASKERDGESFGHHVTREAGDDDRPEPDRVRQLVAGGSGEVDDADDEAAEVAWEADEPEDELSAEEAAMHLTADPPMDDDDGYIDED